jgi:hypothetical protein
MVLTLNYSNNLEENVLILEKNSLEYPDLIYFIFDTLRANAMAVI